MTEAIVYDFGKLLQDAKAGAAWPEADYDFEVAEADAVTASTGSAMIKTKLRCLVGTYAGKHVTNNFVLTPDNPAALMMFFRHMKAFGLDETFFASIGQGNLQPVAAALRGRRARITLGHREWQGVMQNDVKAVKPITEGIAGGPQLGASLPGQTVVPPPPATTVTYAQPATPGAVPPPPPPPALYAVPAPSEAVPGAPAAPVTAPAAPAVPPPPAAVVPPPPPPPLGPETPAAQPVYVPPPPPAAAAPAPASNGTVPPGYTAELWATIPEAAQQAILAAQAQPV